MKKLIQSFGKWTLLLILAVTLSAQDKLTFDTPKSQAARAFICGGVWAWMHTPSITTATKRSLLAHEYRAFNCSAIEKELGL